MPREKTLRHKKKPHPRSKKSSKNAGRFICPICRRGFTRKGTVKDPHFPSCVRRNGNPRGLRWDADPSCWTVGADVLGGRKEVERREGVDGGGGGEGEEDGEVKITKGEGDDKVVEMGLTVQ